MASRSETKEKNSRVAHTDLYKHISSTTYMLRKLNPNHRDNDCTKISSEDLILCGLVVVFTWNRRRKTMSVVVWCALKCLDMKK